MTMEEMRTGEGLLCAVDADGHAAALIAATRRLAELTGLRPVFVHACATPDAVGGTVTAMRRLGIEPDVQRGPPR